MDPDDQQRGYLWAEPTPARSDHMLNAFASDGQVVSVNASQASTVELTGLGLGTRTSYTVNLAEADVVDASPWMERHACALFCSQRQWMDDIRG